MTECYNCDNQDACYSYLDTPMCYACYCNQIAHYLYDKYFENLTEEEEDGVYDWVFDNLYV